MVECLPSKQETRVRFSYAAQNGLSFRLASLDVLLIFGREYTSYIMSMETPNNSQENTLRPQGATRELPKTREGLEARRAELSALITKVPENQYGSKERVAAIEVDLINEELAKLNATVTMQQPNDTVVSFGRDEVLAARKDASDAKPLTLH